MSLLSERHLMTVVINPTSCSCHGYEGVMSVLCTPLQVKCYPVKLFSPFTKSIFTKSSTNIKPQYPNVNGCKIESNGAHLSLAGSVK